MTHRCEPAGVRLATVLLAALVALLLLPITAQPAAATLAEDDPYGDVDGDGIQNQHDDDHTDGPLGDPDTDGVPNWIEDCMGSDPDRRDTDGDTVPDGDELGDESQWELCRDAPDTDGDGVPDVHDTDDDNDGIPTYREADDPDSWWNDPDEDGIPNHLDTDSDNDGTADGAEWPGHWKPLLDRAKVKEWVIRIERTGLDHRVGLDLHVAPDSDGDGIPDHLDAWDLDGPRADADGDGLTNLLETLIGSNPWSKDTDGDGIDDGDEFDFTSEGFDVDFDDDGVWDIFDTDDDNDGVPTWWDTGDTDDDGVPDHLDPDGEGRKKDYEQWKNNDHDPEPECEPGQIPDGSDDQEHCVDSDCDGDVDAEESTQRHLRRVSDTIAEWWAELWTDKEYNSSGSSRPSLSDGPCASDDYDCDGIPNFHDDDWTDGPGENGTGDPMCEFFN